MQWLLSLFQPQMLDCGIDMRCTNKQAHPVQFDELLFKCGNDTRQNHAVLRRKARVIQLKIPLLTA